MKRVLVIGDLMTDIVAQLSGPIVRGSDRRAKIVLAPGGSAATQAVWLAKLGLHVDFVARVGAAGVEAQAAGLSRSGVTPHLAADPDLPTGRLICLVEPGGERSFLTDRGANDALCAADISDALIERADLIHLSGYALMAPASRAAVQSVFARAKGRPVSVDPGSAEFLRELGPRNFLALVAGAGVLFPNAEEAATLAGTDDVREQGAYLSARFPLVVVKRGAAGAVAFSGDEQVEAGALAVDVIDTTGAGDAFVAAFLAARLGGEGLPTALERAVAAGTAATEFLGGRPPL